MYGLTRQFIKNLDQIKDSDQGSGLFKMRRGKGIITDELPVDSESDNLEGLELGGKRRIRKRRRKNNFNIGKYSKAISNGYSKMEAKKIARR
jgi:hypothetical protein